MTSAISGEILYLDKDCLIICKPSVLNCDLVDEESSVSGEQGFWQTLSLIGECL